MDLEGLKQSILEIEKGGTSAMDSQLNQLNEVMLGSGYGQAGDSEDSAMIQDVYKCLEGIVSQNRGRKLLLEHGTPSKLCEAIIQDRNGSDNALKILETLMQHSGKSCWQKYTDNLNGVITKFVNKLKEAPLGPEKMECCKHIEKILYPTNGLSDKPFEEKCEKPAWGADMRVGVQSILEYSSGASEEDRIMALKMVGCVVALLSHFENADSFLLSTKEDDSIDGQFMILLTIFSTREVKNILKHSDREMVNQKGNELKSYYSIIAVLMMVILNNNKVQETPGLVQHILPQLAEVIHEVTSFVTFLASKPTAMFDESVVAETVILLSIGCLVDIHSFYDRLIATLPYMVGIGRDNFIKYKIYKAKKLTCLQGDQADDLDDDDKPIDVISCLVVLLSFMVPDVKCCQVLVDCEFFEVLMDYMRLLYETRSERPDARREIQVAGHCIFAASSVAARTERTYPAVTDFLKYVIEQTVLLVPDDTVPSYLKDAFVLAAITLMGDFPTIDPGTQEDLVPFFENVLMFFSQDDSQVDLCESFMLDESMKLAESLQQQANALTRLGWTRRLGVFCTVAGRYPWLDEVIVKANWVDSLIKSLQVGAAQESQSHAEKLKVDCAEGVLAFLCRNYPLVKQQILEKNGIQLAQQLKLEEFRCALTGEETGDSSAAQNTLDATTDLPNIQHNMTNLVGAFVQFVEHMTGGHTDATQGQEVNDNDQEQTARGSEKLVEQSLEVD